MPISIAVPNRIPPVESDHLVYYTVPILPMPISIPHVGILEHDIRHLRCGNIVSFQFAVNNKHLHQPTNATMPGSRLAKTISEKKEVVTWIEEHR
ncbi:hypothetical protein ON010_g18005 [Phytophthora cinnamomi]|nr:hypothetical protein ON010_g18005 [Phytophthora cinnamomi]